VSRTITLIRHAETEANAARRWQGSLNSPLSARGRDQVARLASRFDGVDAGTLVASDLDRAMRTAAALGGATPDPRWREFHVGGWEGLTSDEVMQRFPGELEALTAGEDVAIGGGERMSAFRERILGALDDLIESLDDGAEATVVTHGGAIWAIIGHLLGREGRSAPLLPSHNTARTVLRVDDEGTIRLVVFNDASHLDEVPTQFGPDGVTVTLIRHGQTSGNVAGRWQGRSDSPLTDHGRWQVQAAAPLMPPFDALFTSPLGRTLDTATIIAEGNGVVPMPHDGLVEMSFGSWENMTTTEAAAADPELYAAIYDRGDDQPRGGHGESLTEAGRRMEATIGELARNGGRSLGVVSHGAAIRAYVTRVVGLDFSERNLIPVPRNSSMSKVVYTEQGPVLGAYNVAPHLD
jgi:broad specificity phosphatase PhoE